MSEIVSDTVWGLIEARAMATPDKVFLIDEHDRRVTFADYRNLAEEMAARLWATGIRPHGKTLAWQLPTRIESLVLMAACARLGVRQLPLLPTLRHSELVPLLQRADAGWWFLPSRFRGVDYPALATEVVAELAGIRVFVTDDDSLAPTPDSSELPPAEQLDGTQPLWIYTTSGTTSEPKGALHTDRSLMAGGAAMQQTLRLTPNDRYGVAFPFTHVGGITNIAAALQRGYTLILSAEFEPVASSALFRRHGATLAGGGPVFFDAFLRAQEQSSSGSVLPDLRFMIGGGAPMRPELHGAVRAQIGGRGCVMSYGMTEACLVTSNVPDDPDERLEHSVGRPVPQVNVRVSEGEVQISGEGVFVGYLDAEQNRSAWIDGWFRTGDLGEFDDHGYLRLTGRAKDIIIRKGENISATEIEAVLSAHPAIVEASVIGIPTVSQGERVCAVVRLLPGATLTLEDITAFCADRRLMRQKFPEQLEIVDHFPVNATGKIVKQKLIELFH